MYAYGDHVFKDRLKELIWIQVSIYKKMQNFHV